jgi:hypothetical protein
MEAVHPLGKEAVHPDSKPTLQMAMALQYVAIFSRVSSHFHRLSLLTHHTGGRKLPTALL